MNNSAINGCWRDKRVEEEFMTKMPKREKHTRYEEKGL